MNKKLALAVLIVLLLVGDAYGEDRIVDVHFDDGSVLHNVIFHDYSDEITVKYENEMFTLKFKDLKTLEFKVELANSGKKMFLEAIVTLKIKTKTGIVINDRFEIGEYGSNRPWNFCLPKSISFTNKLTGREIKKSYNITNLAIQDRDRSTDEYYEFMGSTIGERCILKKSKTKAIKSIVFKDD
jgi:hypothetical protein